MEIDEAKVITVAERAVDKVKNYSRQPHYRDNGGGDVYEFFYDAVYNWYKKSMNELIQKPYESDSRTRDKWLQEFWRQEPHWAGAINQCVLVDSARPWTLTGGKNQVRRYANMLHLSNNGKGWRHYFRQESLSYRVTDMGSVTEIGREGLFGPMRCLYHVDAARCRWSGKNHFSLYYYPRRGRMQKWRETDFFNVCSLPHDDEKFHGLGWCATSRAFELIKILYGVMMHDQESIGAKAMRGLMLIQGIEEQQWKQAMNSRDTDMEGKEREYYGDVFIIAGMDEVDAKLVPLSQLPDNFDRQLFLDQTLYGYSLILGYDPREFWPVSSGALGTARETEQQHRKAATKGALEFPHAWQEKFQAELPDTVHFEFEERDTDAELMEAQMAEAMVTVARAMYDNNKEQAGLIDQEQALSFLVTHGIVPGEWTTTIKEAKVVSDEMYRMLEMPEIRRFMDLYPDEEIVQYRWSPFGDSERTIERERVF